MDALRVSVLVATVRLEGKDNNSLQDRRVLARLRRKEIEANREIGQPVKYFICTIDRSTYIGYSESEQKESITEYRVECVALQTDILVYGQAKDLPKQFLEKVFPGTVSEIISCGCTYNNARRLLWREENPIALTFAEVNELCGVDGLAERLEKTRYYEELLSSSQVEYIDALENVTPGIRLVDEDPHIASEIRYVRTKEEKHIYYGRMVQRDLDAMQRLLQERNKYLFLNDTHMLSVHLEMGYNEMEKVQMLEHYLELNGRGYVQINLHSGAGAVHDETMRCLFELPGKYPETEWCVVLCDEDAGPKAQQKLDMAVLLAKYCKSREAFALYKVE